MSSRYQVTKIQIPDGFAKKMSELPIGCKNNYIIGDGGGNHVVHGQYMSDEIDPVLTWCDEPPEATVDMIEIMLSIFRSKVPDVEIDTLWVEHRSYIMDETPFHGQKHDDCSPYTIICYFEIGTGIIGGNVAFYTKPEDPYDIESGEIESVYTPEVGDVVIFSGDHAVTELKATKESISTNQNRRSILTICVNGSP